MDPVTISLLAGGGLSLVDSLIGGGDDFKMSPEQKRMYEMLLKEYKSGEFGYSPAEKRRMQFGLESRLKNYAADANSSLAASASRRGQAWNPQSAVEITGKAGQAYSQGLTEIDTASEREGRRRKAELENALLGVSGGTYVPDEDMDIGGMAGDLFTLLNKKKKPGVADEDIFSGAWGGMR